MDSVFIANKNTCPTCGNKKQLTGNNIRKCTCGTKWLPQEEKGTVELKTMKWPKE